MTISVRARHGAFTAALTTALLLPVMSTAPASAEEYLYENGVDISWTPGPVAVGASATVTVTGLALAGPATVALFDEDFKVLSVDTEITPAAPSVTLPLPTTAKGTTWYVVEVDETNGEASGDAYFGLTVTALPGSVTARFGPMQTVDPGAKAGVITGRTGAGNVPVEVQSRGVGDAWTTLGSTISAADGSYSLAVPTFWVGAHQLRVRTPESSTFDEAVAADSGSVTVRRTKKLHGSKKNSLLYPGGYRWNPCRVLSYRLNPSRMPTWGPSTIRWSLAAVSQETGLRFRYAGTTTHLPHANKPGPFPDATDIAVGWATPKQASRLTGGTAGIGGSWYGERGRALYEGGLILDVTQRMSVRERRQLVLHELGHVIGLDHVNDPKLVMHPSMTRSQGGWWGRGDAIGLAKVGGRSGCVDETSAWGTDRTAARSATPHGTLVALP